MAAISLRSGKCKITLSEKFFTYNGKEHRPDVEVKYNDVLLVKGVDYTLDYVNNIEPGGAVVQVNGIGNYKDYKTQTFEIKAISLVGNAEIQWIDDVEEMCIYTGKEYKPAFKVILDGKELIEGEDADYTAVYEGNVDVGLASVKIIGHNHYQGDFTDYFRIWERDINEVTFEIDNTETDAEGNIITKTGWVFTGKEIIPAFNLTYNGMILVNQQDFFYEVEDNIDVGTAKIIISGIGNYIDYREETFEIIVKDIGDGETQFNIQKIPVYTGQPIIPDLKVTLTDVELIEGTHYTIEYFNNIDAGVETARLVATGIKNFYGTYERTFSIDQKDIGDRDVNITISGELSYNGLAQLPEVDIVYNEMTLEEGPDYSLSGENNINAGSQALVIITGQGNYKGVVRKRFVINASTGAAFTLILVNGEEYYYTGRQIKPEVKLLLDDEEYEGNFGTTYENNENVSNHGAKVIATVSGNYIGTIEKTFSILPISIGECEVSTSEKSYDFINGEVKPKLKISLNGKILSETSFYKITGYEDNINVTNAAKIFYKFISNNFIEKNELQELLFTINPANISACAVVFKDQNITFTGEELTPEFTITLGGVEVAEENYTYSYSNNINAGTYAGLLSLFGKNNLKNSIVKSFTINRVVLNTENCIMRADEYEPGEGLYNMDTLKVYWKKSDEEEILLYLASPQDYSKELLDEKNLDQEIVETTVTITGLGNYSGKVINVFATGTLGAGDFTDAFGQLDKKPGYTYISYSDEMENMFRISSQGKSAIDELNTQLYNHGYVNESVTINTIPIYYLKPNTIIYIRDEETKINGEYVISKINIPLGNSGSMSITATKAMKRDY